MRVISQDGTADMPYEQMVFATFEGKIYAVNESFAQSKAITVARYSTEAKAIKAMRMLQKEYQRIQTTTNTTTFYFAIDYPKVFQFPEDEDVEV